MLIFHDQGVANMIKKIALCIMVSLVISTTAFSNDEWTSERVDIYLAEVFNVTMHASEITLTMAGLPAKEDFLFHAENISNLRKTLKTWNQVFTPTQHLLDLPKAIDILLLGLESLDTVINTIHLLGYSKSYFVMYEIESMKKNLTHIKNHFLEDERLLPALKVIKSQLEPLAQDNLTARLTPNQEKALSVDQLIKKITLAQLAWPVKMTSASIRRQNYRLKMTFPSFTQIIEPNSGIDFSAVKKVKNTNSEGPPQLDQITLDSNNALLWLKNIPKAEHQEAWWRQMMATGTHVTQNTDFIDAIKEKQAIARQKGSDSYAEFKMGLQGFTVSEVIDFLNNILAQTKEQMIGIKSRIMQQDQLETFNPWNVYKHMYPASDNLYLYFPFENHLDIMTSVTTKMGFPTQEYFDQRKVFFDFDERKGKDSNPFLMPFRIPMIGTSDNRGSVFVSQIRTPENATSAFRAFFAMTHEFGHVLRFLNIHTPYFALAYGGTAIEELFSKIMEQLFEDEEFLTTYTKTKSGKSLTLEEIKNIKAIQSDAELIKKRFSVAMDLMDIYIYHTDFKSYEDMNRFWWDLQRTALLSDFKDPEIAEWIALKRHFFKGPMLYGYTIAEEIAKRITKLLKEKHGGMINQRFGQDFRTLMRLGDRYSPLELEQLVIQNKLQEIGCVLR